MTTRVPGYLTLARYHHDVKHGSSASWLFQVNSKYPKKLVQLDYNGYLIDNIKHKYKNCNPYFEVSPSGEKH